MLDKIFNKNKENPDLFEYAGLQTKEQKKSKCFLWILLFILLLLLLPVAFFSGMKIGMSKTCDEKEEVQEKQEPVKEEKIVTAPAAFSQFIGVYEANVSGHQAELRFFLLRNGAPGGSIRFKNWGNKEIEYLHSFRMDGDKLVFFRTCQAKECQRIGAPHPFRQEYKAEIKPNRNLEGTYTGGQSASSWTARRM